MVCKFIIYTPYYTRSITTLGIGLLVVRTDGESGDNNRHYTNVVNISEAISDAYNQLTK